MTKGNKQLTYRDAGVDIDAGDAFVDKIAPMARATRRPEVLGAVGGFASLVKIPKRYKDPVLVAGTDGVGTKLKLAAELGRHDSVGIDLVAMCVNDIVVQGAEPLFFLDYFATGKLDPDQGADVVRGIAEGCKQAGCALVGGETAEMPGFYRPGEYDLAGFAVGVVERTQALPRVKRMRAGDVIIGVASSGVHSNGYSLVRKILSTRGISLDSPSAGSKKTVGELLLAPTQIYVKLALDLYRKLPVRAFAHITGGGLPGNLPRVIPAKLRAVVDRTTWPRPPLFEFLQERGNVADAEMLNTFNWGVGFCIIAAEGDVEKVLRTCARHKLEAWPIGIMEKRPSGRNDFEILW